MKRRSLLWATPLLAATGDLKLGRKVRVVIIGTEGHTSEVTEPAKRLPEIEIVARLKGGQDYRPVLDREKPDVVAVCNDNGARAAAILACAERGLPYIAEKPLAISRADLAKVRAAVERSKVRHTIMLPMRYLPHYQALRQIVASGELGEIAQIGGQKSYKAGADSQWKNKASSYGGTIPWVGIHMLDLMRWTSAREFVETAAFQSRIGMPELGDRENTAAALFRLDNGGVATLRMDYLRPTASPTHEDDRLRLAGTKGVAEWQASTGVTVVTNDAKPRRVELATSKGSLFEDFLRALYLGGPDPIAPADVWRVNEICLVARESAEKGRMLKIA
jgi:predicted dehydrogenase